MEVRKKERSHNLYHPNETLHTFATNLRLMTFQMTIRTLSLSLAAGLMLLSSASSAQSFRGQRAGNVSPKGRVQDCNHSGAIVQKSGDRIFADLNGGQCVLNGARFDFIDDIKEERLGYKVLNFDGLDLRSSSWVAVSFDRDQPPTFHGADASSANFSAMNMNDGRDPVQNVDATNFIATKAKFQGNELKEWYVQGADFTDCTMSSSRLIKWMTDEESYTNTGEDSGLEGAEGDNRRLSMSGALFYNCVFTDCLLPGSDFSDATFDLTKIMSNKKSLFNGCNFENAYFKEATVDGVNLSGAILTKARIENSSFQSTNFNGASFRDATITNCRFDRTCQFNGASFKGATLDGVDLNGANLEFCDLSNCSAKNLIGNEPILPMDCRIQRDTTELTDSTGVKLGIEISDTYFIVVNESRYSDGMRDKRD